MHIRALSLACLVECFLALEIVHDVDKTKSSAKKSLATALFASAPLNTVRANVHPEGAERSKPSTKIVTDWSGITKPLDPPEAPQSGRPETQQSLQFDSPSLHGSATSAIAAFVAAAPLPAMAEDGTGYSKASFFVVLGLFVLSFPGIISLVKRSVKAKVVRKTYECLGPAAPGGRPTRELGGDITAFFQANNYKITEASDVIVFQGTQAPIFGRAAFLGFCCFFCFAALSLVLSICEKAVFGEGGLLGNFWYLSTLTSPLAAKYYLDNAERVDEISIKIVTDSEEMISDVTVQGNDEEIERFQKALDLREKGMVYVKGIID